MHRSGRATVGSRHARREFGLIKRECRDFTVVTTTQQTVTFSSSLHAKGEYHAARETPTKAVHATVVRSYQNRLRCHPCRGIRRLSQEDASADAINVTASDLTRGMEKGY